MGASAWTLPFIILFIASLWTLQTHYMAAISDIRKAAQLAAIWTCRSYPTCIGDIETTPTWRAIVVRYYQYTETLESRRMLFIWGAVALPAITLPIFIFEKGMVLISVHRSTNLLVVAQTTLILLGGAFCIAAWSSLRPLHEVKATIEAEIDLAKKLILGKVACAPPS